tara:strand:- start:38 stop:250 length:213 start_codon:yes stop_codon:yes gene_type:complete
MTEKITFEEFEKKLKYADWRYDMSDDSRAYREGKRQCEFLRNLAIAMGGKWQEAYDAAQSKAWSGISFGS